MLEGYPGLAHRAQPGVWVRPGYKGTEVTVSQAITLKEATQAGFRPYLYICAYVACVHMGTPRPGTKPWPGGSREDEGQKDGGYQ